MKLSDVVIRGGAIRAAAAALAGVESICKQTIYVISGSCLFIHLYCMAKYEHRTLCRSCCVKFLHTCHTYKYD